jgi:HK97 family phage major capsid protein
METTPTSAKAWSPDVIGFAPEDVVDEALILQTATVAGRVEGDEPVLRVGYVDDDDANFVLEGQPIPEADPALNEVVIATGKVAQLVQISYEQWMQSQAAESLSASVRRAIVKKANSAYLGNAATVTGEVALPGLLNVDGVTSLETPVDGNLDNLVDFLAALEGIGSTPTAIITDPTGWATLRKQKTADGSNESLLGAGTDDAERRLLDLPVIVTPAMPAGQGLIIDSAAIVAAVGEVRVANSVDAAFERDAVMLRATWRVGWGAVRPERIGKFTIGAAPEPEG